MSLAIGKGVLSAPALAALGLAGIAVEAIRRLQCWRQVQRERTQLLAMGERELRDLGLSRVDAVRLAEAPAWRNCLKHARSAP